MSLSLASEIHVFPCPNCGETINTSMQTCTFCNSPIDASAAQASADETSRISQAVSDASYIRIVLGALIGFAVMAFVIPFLGLGGLVGFVFVKYAVPILIARWWLRNRRIHTTDPDFRKATHIVWASLGISVLVFLFFRVHLGGLTL